MTTLGKLEKVSIRNVWPKEDANFTPWLAREENIALLSDELNIDLEVQGQEENVGPFRADILCKDISTDRYVVIENQFGKTDHNHLGQIMTYSSGLEAHTIIWIAEKFVEEHRAALDWLNNITDDSVEFFGIEIELYKIGDSVPAPKFNIVSKPNDWSKTVKRTAFSGALTETKLLQQEYWQRLKDYVEKSKPAFRMQKPLPQHWTNITIGKSYYHLSALANTSKKNISVIILIYGDNSIDRYKKLKELYEEDSYINLSKDLEWTIKEGQKDQSVKYTITDANPTNKSDWERQHKLLKEWIEKFHNYFKDKIKDL